MTQSVDDVWAALKARTAPGTSRGKAPLPSVGLTDVEQEIRPCAASTQRQPDGKQQDNALGKYYGRPEAHNEEPIASLQRDINCLVDGDRIVRLKAIRSIREQLAPSGSCAELPPNIPWHTLQKRSIAVLGDDSEACREEAIGLLAATAGHDPDRSNAMPAIIEALRYRMAVGEAGMRESSEELRHSMVRFVSGTLVDLSCTCTWGYVGDIAALLVKGLDDPYHETKRDALTGIERLAKCAPYESLRPAVGKLVDAIVLTLQHAHSRVRSTALKSLDSVVRHAPVSIEVLSSQVASALKVLGQDRNASIRQATFVTAAAWVADFAKCSSDLKAMDTSKEYTAALLPVPLLGLTDSSPDVASCALSALENAGTVYCTFCLGQESSVSRLSGPAQAEQGQGTLRPAEAAKLPHPFQGRAPPALCSMVQNVLPAVLPPAMKEVKEWTVAQRLTASRNLFGISALAEAALLPYLPVLMPALCNAVGDEDEAVVLRIVKTAQIVGAFCEVSLSVT
jgi:hypothetical protein